MMNNRAHQPDTDILITGSTIVVISPKTGSKQRNAILQSVQPESTARLLQSHAGGDAANRG
jgi:hypothetical protein